MRIVSFIVFIVFSYSNLLGQTESDFYANKLRFKYIELNRENYNATSKLRYKNFVVIDARPDTGKIGYFSSSHYSIGNSVYKLGFEKGINNELETFLSGYYNQALAGNECSVLMVIRKFWFSEYDTAIAIKAKSELLSRKMGLLRLKLEFYIKKVDNYYPLYRFDSSIKMLNDQEMLFSEANRNSEVILPNIAAYFTSAIILATHRLFEEDPAKILEVGKRLSLRDIIDFSRRQLNVPVLNEVKYKKGVYFNFNDFKQNSPGSDYVGVSMDKYGDVLFVKDGNGKEYPTNKVWGYCDGENMFITSGKNFFKLIRTQNSFEFYGIKNLKEGFNYMPSEYNSYNKSSGLRHIKIKKPDLNLFPYQVDMETGEVL